MKGAKKNPQLWQEPDQRHAGWKNNIPQHFGDQAEGTSLEVTEKLMGVVAHGLNRITSHILQNPKEISGNKLPKEKQEPT